MKFIEMSDYNCAARVYWFVMVAAGLLTGAWGVYQCFAFTPVQWAQLLALVSLVVSVLRSRPATGREDTIARITTLFLDGARRRPAG